MFDRELDCFGVTPVNDRIADQGSLARTYQSFAKPAARAKTKHEIFLLALECYFSSVSLTAHSGVEMLVFLSPQNTSSTSVLSLTIKRLLDNYLERYFGLTYGETVFVYGTGELFSVILNHSNHTLNHSITATRVL